MERYHVTENPDGSMEFQQLLLGYEGWENIPDGTDLFTHPPIREGYMMVPIEPTEEMIKAGWFHKHKDSYEPEADCYKAMIAAVKKD